MMPASYPANAMSNKQSTPSSPVSNDGSSPPGSGATSPLTPGHTKGLAGFWSAQNDEIKGTRKKRLEAVDAAATSSPEAAGIVVENTPQRLEGVVRSDDPGEWQKPIPVEPGRIRNVASALERQNSAEQDGGVVRRTQIRPTSEAFRKSTGVATPETAVLNRSSATVVLAENQPVELSPDVVRSEGSSWDDVNELQAGRTRSLLMQWKAAEEESAIAKTSTTRYQGGEKPAWIVEIEAAKATSPCAIGEADSWASHGKLLPEDDEYVTTSASEQRYELQTHQEAAAVSISSNECELHVTEERVGDPQPTVAAPAHEESIAAAAAVAGGGDAATDAVLHVVEEEEENVTAPPLPEPASPLSDDIMFGMSTPQFEAHTERLPVGEDSNTETTTDASNDHEVLPDVVQVKTGSPEGDAPVQCLIDFDSKPDDSTSTGVVVGREQDGVEGHNAPVVPPLAYQTDELMLSPTVAVSSRQSPVAASDHSFFITAESSLVSATSDAGPELTPKTHEFGTKMSPEVGLPADDYRPSKPEVVETQCSVPAQKESPVQRPIPEIEIETKPEVKEHVPAVTPSTEQPAERSASQVSAEQGRIDQKELPVSPAAEKPTEQPTTESVKEPEPSRGKKHKEHKHKEHGHQHRRWCLLM